MTDLNPREAIGGNNPPSPIDDITAPFDDSRVDAESRLDGKPITSEAEMRDADALRIDMRKWRIALEAGQKAHAAPLYEAYKDALDSWKLVIADAKRIESGLVGIVDPFKRKLAAEKAEAARLVDTIAREAADKARAAAMAADATNIEDTRAADAMIAEAEALQKAAKAAVSDGVKGMRWYDCHEILDMRAAVNWIATHDKDAMRAFTEAYVAKNATRFPAEVVRNYREQRAS